MAIHFTQETKKIVPSRVFLIVILFMFRMKEVRNILNTLDTKGDKSDLEVRQYYLA